MTLLNILSDESKWTKDYFAKDSVGYRVHSKSSRAVCWCLMGAILKNTDCMEQVIPICNKLVASLPDRHRLLDEFNDHPETTYKDVVNLIKKAGV